MTIAANDQPQVVVDAVRTAPRERLDRVKLDVHVEGSTVVVDANQRDDGWFGSRNNVVRTDLDIKVPTRTNLDVRVFSSPVDTFSGSIDLHVPDSARGNVRFHSFSGHLTSELPLTLRKSTRRGVEGTFGGDSAGGAVNLKTFSGNVRIDK